jgi:hypothetical protein
MAKAQSNRSAIYYKSETNWGETPSGGAFTQLRFTGESIDRDKDTARSETIRADRMTDDLAVLGYNVAGDVNFELSYSTWDTFLEALCGGTWSNINLSTLNVSASSGAKTFTRSSGSWITDGIIPGMEVLFGGFVATANNARFLVTGVTATVITVADPNNVIVTEAGTGNETAVAQHLVTGVTERSFVFEKQFQDISKFMYFNGCRISDFELDITARQVIKGKMGVIGKAGVPGAATVSGSLVAANANSIMSASANVGQLMKDGVALTTGIKSIKLQLQNDMRRQEIVADQAAGGVAWGSMMVKGTLEAYFEDLVLLNNLINHDTIALSFRTTDAASNIMTWTIPSIKLTKGSPKAAGKDQDIMLPFEFEAIRNVNSNSMVVITR